MAKLLNFPWRLETAATQYEVSVHPINSPYMNYDQGLFEYETNDSVKLPFVIESGHARRFKLKSFLVMPGHAANQIRELLVLHEEK